MLRLRRGGVDESAGHGGQGNAAGPARATGFAYARGVPITVRLIVVTLLATVGLALVVTAVLGARSRLRRNRWVGVRTASTLASETQFVAGNRAAAAPCGAAGAVAGVAAAVLAAGPQGVLGWVVLTIAAVAIPVLAGLAGMIGDRAAAATPAPAPFSASCAGTCAGCDLVAGCRGAVTSPRSPDRP